MFRRSFMQAFKVRKYAIPSGNAGTVSSNFSLNGFYELRTARICVFLGVSLLMISATGDFEFFYQVITHTKQPYNKTVYENSIPNSVKVPNEQIIENYNTLDEMKQFLRIFEM